MKENQEFSLAFDFVHYTNRNIFLTGKAGTGKTTFLHKLKGTTSKRMVVVAPTGVAAINAGGVTIHSFFQMPFGPIIPGRLHQQGPNALENKLIHRFSKKKINIIKTLDLLVIDEISMVRADLLDGIDQVLRRYKNRTLPFGGVQMLMIGDLQQLAPVVKNDEWALLKHHYDTMYFFSSKAFQASNAISIELKHVYRQQDNKFLHILNEIRNNTISNDTIKALNERFDPGFNPDDKEGYITLTTHNANANRMNEQHLQKINSEEFKFEAKVEGMFPEYSFPADEKLSLKVGAQVMFVKNDSSYEKRYFNGKIGKVVEIDEETITVKCQGDENPILVEHEMWENIKYTINDKTKEVAEDVVGNFYQFPLRLAWAITIHKSQGLTFERAIIDARAAFAHGQTYVALSRCKTLEGLVLSSQILSSSVILDGAVNTFNQNVEENVPDARELQSSRQVYLLSLMEELFNFRQLQYQLEKTKLLAQENPGSFIGNLEESMTDMMGKGTRVMNEVGGKFIPQLKKIIMENPQPEFSDEFKERISKAGTYFLEKTTNDLIHPLELINWETDNKLLAKETRERISKIWEMLAIKKACLLECNEKFTISSFLHKRAIASLEELKPKKKKETPLLVSDAENPVLFAQLKTWRNDLAQAQNVPHYRIASQKLLIGISNALPRDLKRLKLVKGMGPKKILQYGTAILEMVSDYCRSNGIENVELLEGNDEVVVKKHSREISLEMFAEGKSLAEIAGLRNYSVQTIEGHMAHFVENGMLPIHRFVEPEKRKLIQSFFFEYPEARLSTAKEALGDEISYSDLKFVRSHLNHQEQEKV